MILKDAWSDWCSSEITREQRKDLITAMEDMGAQLIRGKDHNLHDDTYLRGFIAGIVQALSWEPVIVDENGNIVELDALVEGKNEA